MKTFPKLLIVCFLSSVSVATLANVTGQLEVKLNIYNNCLINGSKLDSNESLKFGTLDFGKVPSSEKGETLATLSVNATNGITLSCDIETPINVSVNAGLNANSSGERYLKSIAIPTAENIHYSIYRDINAGTEFKANTVQGFVIPNTGSLIIPIAGRVHPNTGSTRVRGDYRDTLMITFSF